MNKPKLSMHMSDEERGIQLQKIKFLSEASKLFEQLHNDLVIVSVKLDNLATLQKQLIICQCGDVNNEIFNKDACNERDKREALSYSG